jgi:hypothetical protein
MYIAFACPPVESSLALGMVLPSFFIVELRYVFPLRNKFLRPALLSADGCSGVIGGRRGMRECSRSGRVAVVSVPDLGVS